MCKRICVVSFAYALELHYQARHVVNRMSVVLKTSKRLELTPHQIEAYKASIRAFRSLERAMRKSCYSMLKPGEQFVRLSGRTVHLMTACFAGSARDVSFRVYAYE